MNAPAPRPVGSKWTEYIGGFAVTYEVVGVNLVRVVKTRAR